MSKTPVKIKVNGTQHSTETEPRQLLVHFLRRQLRLTGTHVGCDTGNCGACTVVLDGRAVKACMLFAVQAHGSDVLTVEGLAEGPKLHPLQEAFWENHGLQCGYCTPGMLMAGYALLKENPNPTQDEIRRAIAGNLCRCTGYVNILKAISAAAQKMKR